MVVLEKCLMLVIPHKIATIPAAVTAAKVTSRPAVCDYFIWLKNHILI